MDWKRIIAGVVIGAIVGIAGTFFALHGRISKLEGIIEQLNSGVLQQEKETSASGKSKVKPDVLVLIIQEQQRKNVKESWGELAHQCFTDNDLAKFVQNKTTEQITESLKRDPKFLDVVLAIRQMEPSERKKLLSSVDKPLRPTWAELGTISREGQTEAGQKAEKMIARAIVNLVKELVKMSEDKFFALYND